MRSGVRNGPFQFPLTLLQEQFWRERFQIDTGTLICHRWDDQSAVAVSGSVPTSGMVVVPCSMEPSGGWHRGWLEICSNAVQTHLKEGRPLVIAPGKCPNLLHLRNLTTLAEAGARIAPPIPAWYTQPESIDDMLDFLVMRLFDSLRIPDGPTTLAGARR